MTREIKFRIPMFTDKGRFTEFQYLRLGDDIIGTLCGTNGQPQQYIGIKDKNANEIYEGDILKHDRYSTEFKEGNVEEFVVENIQQFFEERGFYTAEMDEDWDAENFEIIGNIYENPELIK